MNNSASEPRRDPPRKTCLKNRRKVHSNAYSRTRGFSIIELLTVMFVIGVCLTLFIPMIVKAREAANRTTCRNRLCQIGIAMHTYYSIHNVLPPGSVDELNELGEAAETYNLSWMTQLLPSLEQTAAYRQIDFKVGLQGNTAVTVPTFVCPQVNKNVVKLTKQKWGGMGFSINSKVSYSTYAGNYGDGTTGYFMDANGILYLNSSVRWGDIRDGTANTIMVGERLPTPWDEGWMAGNESTLRHTGGGIGGPESTVVKNTESKSGALSLPSTGFESAHKNVGMFLLSDGSVRTIRKDIDEDVFRKLGNRHDGELTPQF